MGRKSREKRDRARAIATGRGLHPDAVRAIPQAVMQPRDGLFVETPDGTHRWAVINTFGLSDDEVITALANRPMLLDVDHLVQTAGSLCLVCEEPAAEVLGKPCAGDPWPARLK